MPKAKNSMEKSKLKVKETASESNSLKAPFAIILLQGTVAAAAILFFLLEIMEISFSPLSLAFSGEGFDYFILIVLLVLLAATYFLMKRKYPVAYEINKAISFTFFGKQAKRKIAQSKDPNYIAIIMIEIMLVLFIIIALLSFIDDKIALIKGGFPPYFKWAVGLLLIVVAFYFYNYTKPFRIHERKQSEKKLKKSVIESVN